MNGLKKKKTFYHNGYMLAKQWSQNVIKLYKQKKLAKNSVYDI